jgi:hypothetical protein
MKKILCLVLVCSTLSSFGQLVQGTRSRDENEAVKANVSGILDFKSRLFVGLGSAIFIDFISSPLTFTFREYQDPPLTPGGPNVIRREPAAAQTTYNSFYTMSIEPRYNLLEPTDDIAFAFTSPLGFGFGQSYPTDSDVQGSTGFGNVQLAAMGCLYYGSHATYNSNQDFGINLSAGFEVNKIGVINLDQGNRDLNKAWIMPTTRVGVQFYRGYSPVEINIKYGFGPRQDQVIDGWGYALSSGKVVRRASSLKLSIVYLVN